MQRFALHNVWVGVAEVTYKRALLPTQLEAHVDVQCKLTPVFFRDITTMLRTKSNRGSLDHHALSGAIALEVVEEIGCPLRRQGALRLHQQRVHLLHVLHADLDVEGVKNKKRPHSYPLKAGER